MEACRRGEAVVIVEAGQAFALDRGAGIAQRRPAGEDDRLPVGRDPEILDIDWASLARGGSTLAFYMGREAAGEIRRGLMRAGMPGEMPVMIACAVSSPGERRLVTRLDLLDLATKSFAADAPTLILVGPAVALAGSASALPANASRAAQGQ